MIIAVFLLAAGCAKNYRTAVTGFRDAPVCCSSLADIPVEPLKMGGSTHFTLEEGTPAFRFATGKSYFRAFRLPDGPYPYRVTIDSYLVGGYLKSAYLFRPVVLTLDADRTPVRTIAGGDFTVERAGFAEAMWQAGGLKQKLSGGVDFTAENRERYLVVLTTDALLKETTAVPVGGDSTMLLLGSGGVAAKTEEVRVPHAPTGRLGISVEHGAVAAAAGHSGSAKPVAAPVRTAAPSPAPVHATAVRTTGPEPAADLLARPETVRVHMADGTGAGTLELGRSDIGTARALLVSAGIAAGEAQAATASYLAGPATLALAQMLAPAGTPHRFYFDAAGRLVLAVDRAPAGIPATIEAFRSRFPSSWETGRTLASVEFQTLLSPCVALVAVYRTADGGLDLAAYGYSCEPQ
jgi:hypothetical protein